MNFTSFNALSENHIDFEVIGFYEASVLTSCLPSLVQPKVTQQTNKQSTNLLETKQLFHKMKLQINKLQNLKPTKMSL